MMNNLLRRFGLRRESSSDNQTKHTFDEEFFAFRQFGTCGFPNKPSCLALDEKLGLLAIGTRTGFIHIFGKPGVHLQGEHDPRLAVVHISFLKGKSKLVTVCEDGSFVVWTLKTSENESKNEETAGLGENEDISSDSDTFPDFDSILIRGERKKLDIPDENIKISCCCLDDRIIQIETVSILKSTPEDGQELRVNSQVNLEAGSDPTLYVGMTDGNVFSLPIREGFVDVSLMNEHNVGYITLSHEEVIVNHFSEEEVKSLGVVVSIVLHPTVPHKVLVGYSVGFTVMWNVSSLRSECVFSAYQQLENLAFNHDGSEFVSSHSDGSYIIWNTIDCTEPREAASTPYGPYQCEAINKFIWKTNESSSLMIFSGGMPRSGYGDRWTVTIMRGDGDEGEQSHVVLDLTSRVIDFVAVDSVDSIYEDDEDKEDGPNIHNNSQSDRKHQVSTPHSLVVLAEEEMIVIDLVGRDWPSYRLPHLTSPHCSAITSVFHASEVPDSFLRKLSDAGRLQQMKNVTFTRKTWPFLGGQTMFSKDRERDLLLTGHEDGSVRFWQTKHGDIQLLYRLDTAHLFGIELSNNSEMNNDSDEDWPPFKKVGAYNPFTDDPRLAIRQIILSTSHDLETLVLAGTAGQIIVCEFSADDRKRMHRKSSCREHRDDEMRDADSCQVGSNVSAVANFSLRGPSSETSMPSSSVSQAHASSENTQKGGGPPGRSTLKNVASPNIKSLLLGPSTDGRKSGERAENAIMPSISAQDQHCSTVPSSSAVANSDGISLIEQHHSQIGAEKENPNSINVGEAQNSTINRESYSSSFSSSSLQFEIKVSSVNLVGDRDDFVWMGHTPLEVVNPNNKNRPRAKSTHSTSPSSVFMPYPLTSSLSYSAVGDAGPGFHASCVVLVHPPVSCTSLALQASWQLIGFGSEYGYGLYDYVLGKIVFSKSSKSDHSIRRSSTAFPGNSRLSDMFRRTVRASFRKLERARSEFRERRRRSQQSIWKSFSVTRGAVSRSLTESTSLPPHSMVVKETIPQAGEDRVHSTTEKPSSSSLNNSEPHKRSQNAGSNDLFKGGSLDRDPQSASLSRAGTPIVRCLYFAEDNFALSSNSAKGTSGECPEFGTFWVGTSQGTIYMYNITISPAAKRVFQPVIYSLAKEIHLKHEAPILDICILSKSGLPLHSDLPEYPMPVVNRNRRWKFPSSIFGSLMSSSSSSGQCLVVCSQKQVKVFSYPGLKAKRKVKVDRATSLSGSFPPCGTEGRLTGSVPASKTCHPDMSVDRQGLLLAKNITKVAYSSFENKSDESVVESGLVCLTDDGGASVYSMPSLKLRFLTSSVSKEFMNDMKLCVLTSHGYGFYLCSPSEFGKFSMSTTCPKIRSLSLLPLHPMLSESQKKKDSEGSKKSSSEEESFKRTPNSGSVVVAAECVPTIDQARVSHGESSRALNSFEIGRQELCGSLALQNVGESLGSVHSPASSLSMSGIDAMKSVANDDDVVIDRAMEGSGTHFRKVTDISHIKDEQMIEKIINKFVQMDVPSGSSAACRKEIQFSVPLQQKSQSGVSLEGACQSHHHQELREEDIFKPVVDEEEVQTNVEGCMISRGATP